MTHEIAAEIEREIDIDSVVASAKDIYGWSDDDAAEAKGWYIKHLALCKKFPDRELSALSRRADELWHLHILDTKKYAADCNALFGKFIHHLPIYGEATDADEELHASTSALYMAEFGVAPDDLSPLSSIPRA